jgi:3-oxoacyl-[acyl-carrier-protein] synthase III
MLNSQVYLESIAHELPPCVVSSQSILEQLRPSLERLRIPGDALMTTAGVVERRFWPVGTTIVESATSVARKAIEASGLRPSDIGAIISTSVCKDFIEPSMASMIHGELGLSPACLNLDVGNACLGFMNGISLLAQLIEHGAIKAALVVDAESSREVVESTIERLLRPDAAVSDFQLHFATLTLGSGAVAAVLTHESISRKQHRLVGQVTLADTQHSRLCLGSRDQMLVQPRPLLEAGLALARRTWILAQKLLGWTSTNIDFIVGHQVGAKHFKSLLEIFRLEQAASFMTYPFLGNVGPASVPLTLALAVERGLIQPGFRLGLMGIGSGLNCSMMQIDW